MAINSPATKLGPKINWEKKTFFLLPFCLAIHGYFACQEKWGKNLVNLSIITHYIVYWRKYNNRKIFTWQNFFVVVSVRITPTEFLWRVCVCVLGYRRLLRIQTESHEFLFCFLLIKTFFFVFTIIQIETWRLAYTHTHTNQQTFTLWRLKILKNCLKIVFMSTDRHISMRSHL